MTAATQASDRIWTIPNLLSGLRLLGVPLFLWLALGPEADGAALGVLAFAGVSDYLDGKLARVLNQTSRLGVMLDPLADRLYILATIVALTLRDIVPLWFAVLLVARDAALLLLVPILRRLGVGTALPVHYLGKAATFNLLYAFPLLLLSAGDSWLATAARPVGWAFAIWGVALYWWSGLLYFEQARRLAVERARPVASATSGKIGR
ncbi:CDP-diacylglycerol--glycerol-3-phosphate 3-phosphatidyltransferase [Frankia sp. CcI49]|uniref:CDP-diacylglycerol--glycerol-3-phosphate 3-phosphatidyltransferase n=1 Tax=Parafrankia irregularis TaxID=795642 RepID=A0A0S4QWP1_9ACTN|nr:MULTISPECIES: CDP-alcohol phosphatidyltransferase family protein [Frankiaceae]KPM55813.1 CDP-diacylglycerol--glycerol-3-phosphate 3-phosphatidyltransferase [Frankia sp. R43]MBE3201911.1 CDP-alcohol phosphatidyltransferase family protein [Parafrankia sp. CH37]ONH58325.1 CDP-diacylglycerol--glycerol-3-phosphate 3-phosphatidyltransferase [Frankia sp. CcI49]CUU59502.1 CDP-diacylglycerol--glycerol-3-phosphate 3-phosphatidyltransferase [Parafrankia irregularis]